MHLAWRSHRHVPASKTAEYELGESYGLHSAREFIAAAHSWLWHLATRAFRQLPGNSGGAASSQLLAHHTNPSPRRRRSFIRALRRNAACAAAHTTMPDLSPGPT